MKELKVKRVIKGAKLPEKAHENDAGFDIFACFPPCRNSSFVSHDRIDIPPGDRRIVDTGIQIEPPDGYWCQIETRSGMASKGIVVVGGIIDSGYRGNIKVILLNCSEDVYSINQGDKIAQIVLREQVDCRCIEVNALDNTDRGEKGFGSSGQ